MRPPPDLGGYDTQLHHPPYDAPIHKIWDLPIALGMRMLFIGEPRSGKSRKMTEIVASAKEYHPHLKTILIAPNFLSDWTWINASNDYRARSGRELIDQHFKTFGEDVQDYLRTMMHNYMERRFPIMILYDDTSTDHRMQQQKIANPVLELYTQTAQLNVIGMFSAWRATLTPKNLRTNSELVFIQLPPNVEEDDEIRRDFMGRLDRDTAKRIMREAWREPYDTLLIWRVPGRRRFFRYHGEEGDVQEIDCFDQIEALPDEPSAEETCAHFLSSTYVVDVCGFEWAYGPSRPGLFTAELNIPVTDVVGAYISAAEFPRTWLQISSQSNTLIISVNGAGWVQYIIETGNYTALQLQNAITVAIAASGVYCTYNETLGKMIFTHDTLPFVISGQSHLMLQNILGMNYQDISSVLVIGTVQHIIMPFPYHGSANYDAIYISCRQIYEPDCGYFSDPALEHTVARIPVQFGVAEEKVIYAPQTQQIIQFMYKEPRTIRNLTISAWARINGNPSQIFECNFQGLYPNYQVTLLRKSD